MTNMKGWTLAVAIAAAGALNGGCLVKDSLSTPVLEPDGTIRWAVSERNIHAVADTPADRLREEKDYMGLVATAMHPVAAAFRALGAQDVRIAASADWPYTVRTDARFPDIARLWQDYFDRVALPAASRLERSGGRTTWTLTVDVGGQESDAPDDDNLDALLEGDQRPTLLIRHGQFVDSVGFTVSDDGRVAKLDDFSDRDWDKQPRLVLSLTWVATEAMKAPAKR